MEELLTPTAPLMQQETNAVTVENPEFTEPAPPPEAPAPEKLTPKQIGQLRRQYMTITHGTVKACGHLARFNKDHDPKNNCVNCWAAYFATSVDLEFIHTVLTTKGVKALVAMKGTKFTKMFHGFLSSQLLPALAAETQVETPAMIQGGTFDRSGEVQNISPTIQNIG
jgi:hypothetical protein